MGSLSEHFREEEFACRCGCGEKDVSPDLVLLLEAVREHFNAPIHVLSGRRCESHNRAVGGAKHSQHLLGTAADIVIRGVSPDDVFAYLDPIHRGGLGKYSSFTHLDVRGSKARWKG